MRCLDTLLQVKNFYGTTTSSIETLEPGSLANGRARSISDNSRVHTILSKMSPNSRLQPNPSPFRTLQDSFAMATIVTTERKSMLHLTKYSKKFVKNIQISRL